MNIGKIIAIDPGEHNGYAIYVDAKPVEFGTLMWEAEFLDWLNEQTPDVFVVENYLVDPNVFAHRWSTVPTIQAIGAIKLRARVVGCPVVLQPNNIKPVAYGQMGAKYVKGKKDMHHMDAMAHGHHFLVKQGLITPGVK